MEMSMHGPDENPATQRSDQGAGYTFTNSDLPDEKIARIQNSLLIHKLSKVNLKIQGVTKSARYEDVRLEYIMLNKALNTKGVIAPRFRPSLSAGGRKGVPRTKESNLISNDHQVIDLHWLSVNCGFDQGRNAWLPDRWHGMFLDGLDYGVAQVFAGTGGASSLKATDILRLTADEEVQLRSIQSEATRRWWSHRKDNREQVRAAVLSGQIKNAKLRGCENTWPNAWLAIECASRAGLSAGTWYEMITGNELPGSTISNIKKRIPKLVRLDADEKSVKSERKRGGKKL